MRGVAEANWSMRFLVSLGTSSAISKLVAISYQPSAIRWLPTAFSCSTKIPRPKYQDQRAKVKKQNTTQNATTLPRFALQPCISCPVAFHPAPFTISRSGFCFSEIATPSARNDTLQGNPKPKALNPKQIPISKLKAQNRFSHLDFGHLILFSISDLGFRIWSSRDCHAFGSQ